MTKLARDTWLLFTGNLRTTLRNPVWVIMSLFQPACYLLLFAPVLEGLHGHNVPGFEQGRPFDVFAPGLLVMLAYFSTAYVGFTLIANLRAGVVERLRVTPVSRLALLLGLVVRDVVVLLVQCGMVLVVAFFLGLRPNAWGLLLTPFLLVLIGLMMASFSYALALAVKHEGSLASTINFVAIPMLMLSGFTLPLALAPPILQAVARFNPFAHAVFASRALMAGHLGDFSVWFGFALFGVLAALSLLWAMRSMRQATT